MKKMTYEEMMEALIRESAYLIETETVLFTRFIEKYRLKTRFIDAVNEKYKSLADEDFNRDATCAFATDFVSCFIDWNKSSDDNWSYINGEWQDYRSHNS